MKSKSKKWLIWMTVIIIGLIISGIALSSGSTEEKNGRASVKVKRKNIVEKALAVGSIEPVTEIEVKSKVSGVVGKLYVEVGSYVNAGDPLVEVKPDPTPLERAQATRDVEMASIELETIGKELERDKKLKQQGYLSDQDFEILLGKYDETNLRKKMAMERLDLIEKGKIANTNIETVVKSPLTGFILEKNVNLGDA